MTTPARRRLMRDFKRLQEDSPAGVSGSPIENNIMLWNAVVFGPEGKLYLSIFTVFNSNVCLCVSHKQLPSKLHLFISLLCSILRLQLVSHKP